MHTRRILTILLCACCWAAAGGAFAQDPRVTVVPVVPQNEQMMRDLERARREIEKAAQEVGRLYAQNAEEYRSRFFRGYAPFLGRSFLGVVIEDTELGARVTAVTPNGPAASAGVLVGDTIVAIDGVSLVPQPGQPSTATETLMSQMGDVEAGETVDLRVLRDGDYRDVDVTIRGDGQWFSFEALPKLQQLPQLRLNGKWAPWPGVLVQSQLWSDFEFVTMTSELGEYFGTTKGLLVVSAPDDNDMGFRDGDVILDIGGREPQSPEHAFRILGSFAPGESLRVSIMRKQARQTLEIKIPGEAPADSA